jgi:hypothetical protein
MAYSEIPMFVLCGLNGGEKNSVWSLWSGLAPNLRSQAAMGARSLGRDARIYLEIETRRVRCRSCAKVKQERLAWLSDNPFYNRRFVFFVGRRCRTSTIQVQRGLGAKTQ